MAHHCHATNCTTPVPPEMFMCKRHWFSLLPIMRKKIWRTYRVGQCDDWQPSREYCDVAIECVSFIAKLEGVKPDIRLYKLLREAD